MLYIDPLSGSIILQVVAAAGLAVAFTAKRFWLTVRDKTRQVWTRLTG